MVRKEQKTEKCPVLRQQLLKKKRKGTKKRKNIAIPHSAADSKKAY